MDMDMDMDMDLKKHGIIHHVLSHVTRKLKPRVFRACLTTYQLNINYGLI